MKYQHDQGNPATNEEVHLNTDGDEMGDESLTTDLHKKKNVMAILVERKLVLEKVEVEVEEAEALHQEEIRRLERLKGMLEWKEALHQEAIDTERDHRIAVLRKELERNRHSCSRGLGYCSPGVGNKLRDGDIGVLEAVTELQRIK